jgi:hypothetical protein
MRDLMNNIHPVIAVAPQSVGDGSSLLSGAIDLAGYESCTFVIMLGALADADATWTVTVHEGSTDTQSAHTAVADIDLIGTEALAGFQFDDDNSVKKVGYKGGSRYVSIEIDNDTANAGAALIGVLCILGHPKDRPTDNPPA